MRLSDRIRTSLLALAIAGTLASHASAQNFLLEIDELEGIQIANFPGTGVPAISPYFSDWVRHNSVSFTFRQNRIFDPQGELRVVSLARILSPAGDPVAESEGTVVSFYQTCRFVTGAEAYTFGSPQINFMRSPGSGEGAMQFRGAFTADTRLPGGGYRLAVTLWEYDPGEPGGLGRQLSEEYIQEFTLPPDEEDLALDVTVNERSPFFSDWQVSPAPAEIRVANRWRRRYEVYMDARIEDARGTVIETRPAAGLEVVLIVIPAAAEHVLPAATIPFFNPAIDPASREDFFQFRDDVEDHRRAGRLPEGFSYRLCVQLRDYDAIGTIRGIYHCSEDFRIDYPPAPELTQPENEEIADRLPTLRWEHDIPLILQSSLRYTLQIKESPEPSTPIPDLFRRLDRVNDIEETDIIGLAHQFLAPDRRLVEGHRYAWRVIASTPSIMPPIRFQNDGESDIRTFTYMRRGNIPPPVLEAPDNAASIALPRTLDWTDVRLHDGSAARYIVKTREIAEGIVPAADYLEASAEARSVTVDASQAGIPDERLGIAGGHTYAWQVRAFDPAGRDENVFDNDGLSDIRTFTIASAGEGDDEEAITIVLNYPSDGIRIADDQPPFVADPLIDRSGTRRVTLTIEELERAGGGPLAEPRIFSSSGPLTESHAMLFLNGYGAGGIVPAGQPFFAVRWSAVPGSRYRWTLEIASESGEGPVYRQSTEFVAAPRAAGLSPSGGGVIDPRDARLRFLVTRPVIDLGAGHGVFAPGDPPAGAGAEYVMNPVIRTAGGDGRIVYEASHSLSFPAGIGAQYAHDEEFPRLADGRYTWVVNTVSGGRIVATSDPEEFTITGAGLPCDAPCVCVDGIYPENREVPDDGHRIPYGGEGRFSIGFRPLVNAEGITGGTIRVWIRRDGESPDATEARVPDFSGAYTREQLTSRGDAAELSAFDVDLRDEAGEHIHLQPDTRYMWIVDARFEPVRIRRDATRCPDDATSARSGRLFFTTMREVECAEPCICVIPVSPAPNASGVASTERGRFRVDLLPGVRPEALRRCTIRLWTRHGDESIESAAARLPIFLGFTSEFTRLGDDPESNTFEIDPRDDRGDGAILQAGVSYVWSAEVEFDPATVRRDGESCFEGHDHASSAPAAFSTQARVPDCNPLSMNVSHPAPGSPLPDEVRIGGYRLVLDRAACRMNDGGRITGNGGTGYGVVHAPEGNWEVEFTELEINSDNEVLFGRATTRIRDDIPAQLQRDLQSGGAMTAEQVRSLNRLWHSGGTLLESMLGDRRVPFGISIDEDFARSAASGGWGFKAVITRLVFGPTLASSDIAVGVRAPIATNEGEESQWIGLYAQDIPRCIAPGAHWRSALRLLGDMDFGSASMDDWEFFIKRSPWEEMREDYLLEPGDGTAMVISDRGVEQLHIELGIRVPRNILIPQRETADGSGVWQDVPAGDHGQTELSGVFDYTREQRVDPDAEDIPRDPLGSGFYVITDLPRSRIASMSLRIAARGCVIDFSPTWSPRADAGAAYSVPGLGVGALPTTGAGFNRPPDWEGFFIKEGTIDLPSFPTPLGIRNAFSLSPLSFTAFATPLEEVRIGDSFTARLDTVDFEIDRGNFVRSRVVTSMTFPGAIEGRIGLDFVYQQIPEDGERHEADAFIASLNAREDELIRITDYVSFTIRRGSRLNVTYTDPPLRRGDSRWGFVMDISGGLKFNKRNAHGDDVVSIGGIDFEGLHFATDGRGLQPPRITFFGMDIPRDTARGGAADPHGHEAERKRQVVGGFPIGLRSLDLTFGDDGFSMGVEAVLTLALTGEASEGGRGGPVFGGSIGFALDGMLEMHDGRLRWQAPSLRLTSLGIAFESPALSIRGEVTFYESDPEWGTGFSGDVRVAMAKLFDAEASIRFGAHPEYRYWFVRGSLTSDVPIATIGPVGVYGFIGGAYQHMTVRETRDAGGSVTDVAFTTTADETFGIMAGVHIGVAGAPNTFHAKVLLAAEFRDENLTNISLDGKGWFMCSLHRECNGRDDSWVELRMAFDFAEDRFQASVSGQLNLSPLVRIDAPRGSIDILFEPDNWHVYIGKGPFDARDERTISATFFPDLGGFGAEAYTMAGNSIDVMIGGIPIRGGGFASGVHVEIDLGGKFLIFYGRIHGDLKAELAVIRVEEGGASCISGANGWYALASVNFSLGLEVGIDVDLWFVSGRFEIFSAMLGIDLLIGGPNPTFFDGDARGSYRILDGLISGRFHFHVHIGDEVEAECITAAIDDQFRMPEPIVSVSPLENARNVSVFTTVGLGFSFPEQRAIDISRDGLPVRARFRLEQPLDIRPRSGGLVPGRITFASDSLSAEWSTEDILLERTGYTVNAVAIAEEWRNGRWEETRRYTKTWTFTTGPRPRDIYDPGIIGYSYPLNRQRYSYSGGHDGKHYIHLQRNMDYLFADLSPGQTLLAEYSDQNNERETVPLVYERYRTACGAYLRIDAPPVEPNGRYHLRLIKRTDTRHGQPILIAMPAYSAEESRRNRISASRAVEARGFAAQSGEDRVAFAAGGGSYRAERKEGSANARVRSHGRYIDSVMYDWYFGVGRFASAARKLESFELAYRARLGSFISFDVTSPEPVDDDMTASVFLRPVSARNRDARGWFEFLDTNDKLARDLTTLQARVGRNDANALRPIVLTDDPRLEMSTFTYMDASAPWNFNESEHRRHRLQAWEMEFEEQRPAEGGAGIALRDGAGIFGGPDLRGGAGAGGGLGRGGRIPVVAAPSYTTNIVTCALNAISDLTAMRWRYGQALVATREVRRRNPRTGETWTEEIRVRDGLEASTIRFIEQTRDRSWTNAPAADYTIGFAVKPFTWRMNSRYEHSVRESYGIAEDVKRLDWISLQGTTRGFDFGEFSCGDAGVITFHQLSLRVP